MWMTLSFLQKAALIQPSEQNYSHASQYYCVQELISQHVNFVETHLSHSSIYGLPHPSHTHVHTHMYTYTHTHTHSPVTVTQTNHKPYILLSQSPEC